MSARFFRRSRAALAGLAVCGGLTAGTLAATAGPAAAQSADAQSYGTLTAYSSGLNLDVSGASTAPGGVVIQSYANGGADQNWSVPAVYTTGRIRNQNSGMCLTTDGVAGDQLYQKPCLRRLARYQRWHVYLAAFAANTVTFYNPAFGLAVDVYENSTQAGAPIDAWPLNGQMNQFFTEGG
jgi:hypothetical protein